MYEFDYNIEKSKKLKLERNISFDEIIKLINNDCVVDVLDNHKYSNQKIYVLDVDGYVWLVPYIHDKNTIFLKRLSLAEKRLNNT